jgi:hypothetical protein
MLDCCALSGTVASAASRMSRSLRALFSMADSKFRTASSHQQMRLPQSGEAILPIHPFHDSVTYKNEIFLEFTRNEKDCSAALSLVANDRRLRRPVSGTRRDVEGLALVLAQALAPLPA